MMVNLKFILLVDSLLVLMAVFMLILSLANCRVDSYGEFRRRKPRGFFLRLAAFGAVAAFVLLSSLWVCDYLILAIPRHTHHPKLASIGLLVATSILYGSVLMLISDGVHNGTKKRAEKHEPWHFKKP